MESYSYRCPVCGYVYLVPAYWMSYSPEETTDFPHMKPGTDEICENITLAYMEA